MPMWQVVLSPTQIEALQIREITNYVPYIDFIRPAYTSEDSIDIAPCNKNRVNLWHDCIH